MNKDKLQFPILNSNEYDIMSAFCASSGYEFTYDEAKKKALVVDNCNKAWFVQKSGNDIFVKKGKKKILVTSQENRKLIAKQYNILCKVAESNGTTLRFVVDTIMRFRVTSRKDNLKFAEKILEMIENKIIEEEYESQIMQDDFINDQQLIQHNGLQ